MSRPTTAGSDHTGHLGEFSVVPHDVILLISDFLQNEKLGKTCKTLHTSLKNRYFRIRNLRDGETIPNDPDWRGNVIYAHLRNLGDAEIRKLSGFPNLVALHVTQPDGRAPSLQLLEEGLLRPAAWCLETLNIKVGSEPLKNEETLCSLQLTALTRLTTLRIEAEKNANAEFGVPEQFLTVAPRLSAIEIMIPFNDVSQLLAIAAAAPPYLTALGLNFSAVEHLADDHIRHLLETIKGKPIAKFRLDLHRTMAKQDTTTNLLSDLGDNTPTLLCMYLKDFPALSWLELNLGGPFPCSDEALLTATKMLAKANNIKRLKLQLKQWQSGSPPIEDIGKTLKEALPRLATFVVNTTIFECSKEWLKNDNYSIAELW